MIEKIIKPFLNPIKKHVILPLKRLKNWPKLLAKWIKRQFKQILGKKETTKESYFALGNYYISKKLVIIIIIVILILYFFIFIKPPKFVNKFLNRTPSITLQADGSSASYNGKAKLFTSDKALIYEGELANGVYEGKGKLYYLNKELHYDGQFSRGQFHGIGKLYTDNGLLVYDGSFSNGQYDGAGKLFNADGKLIEQGTFALGILTEGSQYHNDGSLIYTGSYVDGIYEGEGTLYYSNGTPSYQGNFKAGIPHGQGRKYTEKNVLVYEGEWSNGIYTGTGTLYDTDQTIIYQGQFLNGNYHGTGKTLYANGFIAYEGGFSNGKRSGLGTEFFEDGNVKYQGESLSNQYHGKGTLFDQNGNTIYTGSFMNNQYHGAGEKYNSDGLLEYQGSFKYNKLNGIGKWYEDGTRVIYIGNFQDNYLDFNELLKLSFSERETLLGKPASVKSQLDELPEVIPPVEPIIEEQDDPSEVDPKPLEALAINNNSSIVAAALESILPSIAMETGPTINTTAATEQTAIIQGAFVQHFYPQLSLTFTTRQNDISIEEYELLSLTISEGHVLDQFYKELIERVTATPDNVKVVKLGLTHSFSVDHVTYQFKLNLDEKPVTATVDLTTQSINVLPKAPKVPDESK